jgi:predicted DNA-binding antitoxin AbrB/MazE fold protein
MDRSTDHAGRRSTGSAMSKTIHAIYEDGVFRPIEPVEPPEHTAVAFEPRVLREGPTAGPTVSEGLAKVYAILGERFNSGHQDTAERHNEHQP